MSYCLVVKTETRDEFRATLGDDETDAKQRLEQALAQVKSACAAGDWVNIEGQIAVHGADVRSISLKQVASPRTIAAPDGTGQD
jgi:hypothetical protein